MEEFLSAADSYFARNGFASFDAPSFLGKCFTSYANLCCCVRQADLAFFAVNPVGRIVNRFSSDLFTVDSSLPFILNILLAQCAGLTGMSSL